MRNFSKNRAGKYNVTTVYRVSVHVTGDLEYGVLAHLVVMKVIGSHFKGKIINQFSLMHFSQTCCHIIGLAEGQLYVFDVPGEGEAF